MKKFIILLCLLLTGCWNYHELNDLAIVTGIAIDKDDNYRITVLINNPNQNKDDSNLTTIAYEAKGKTIYEAFKNVSLSVSKQLHLSHIELLIISEDIAKNDINKILDFLFRYPQTKNNFQLIVSENCKAGEILKLKSPLKNISTALSNNIKKTETMQGISYQVNFNEFIKKLNTYGFDPVLPTVSLIGIFNESKENIENTKPKSYIKLGNMAIFNKDKFIKIVNDNESKGINILNNKIKIMGIESNIDNNIIVTEINKLNTKYKLKDKFIIEINASGTILEVPSNIQLDKNINKINNEVKNKIKDYVLDAIKLNEQYNIDLFGFKNYLYKNKINNKYKYEIKINLNLNSLGSINNNIEVKD